MQDLPTTPWYPTARLFRQPSPNDWPALLDQVIGELALFAAAFSRPSVYLSFPSLTQAPITPA
jgi:hypothetical protein